MKKFGILLLCFSLLLADEEETHDINFEGFPCPWFTGPLIAPSGYTVKPGHLTFQTYYDAFVNVGKYNRHWKTLSTPNFYNYNIRARLKTGITRWMDVQVIPQVSYREKEGRHYAGFNDLSLSFSFQVLKFGIEAPWPSLRLILSTTIPSGKYQHLNPHRKFTDALGTGSWYPEIALVFSKLFHIGGIHFLETRFFSGYRIATPTSIKGFNAYGGDASTRGTAYPGNVFFADAAFQYNLTQNWALACDLFYRHQDHSRFSGKTSTPTTLPSSEQFSLAPALEYNWSKNLGLIAGVWFSAAGRNTPQFINGIISLNAYF